MSVVVVTGSRGFIGQHLCRRLKAMGKDVYEVDHKVGVSCASVLSIEDDVERVYHLAAQTDARSTDAVADAQNNIVASIRIFKKFGSRVVFTSSSMVNYPVTPYAISKKACEYYADLYGCTVVRLPNVFGPGGHSFMDKCRENREVTIYGGRQIRTWVHVYEAVDALISVRPGHLMMVKGFDLTVGQIAQIHGNTVTYEDAIEGDVVDGRQI
jgi:nucleoside-diphosphate-sugar epimerase